MNLGKCVSPDVWTPDNSGYLLLTEDAMTEVFHTLQVDGGAETGNNKDKS